MKGLRASVLAVSVLILLTSCPEAKSPPESVQDRLKRTFASPVFTESFRRKSLEAEGPFARMVIAKLSVDLIVAEGTAGESLRGGAGHYQETPFPGEVGNVAIAGTRIGNGEPFRHLDQMREGDEIALIVPGQRFTYRVVAPFGGHANPWVTNPRDLSTLAPTSYPAVTLTTTDPPDSAMNRLVLRLRLVRSDQLPA